MYSKLLKRVRRHRRVSVLFRQPVQPGFQPEQTFAPRSVSNKPRAVVVLPSGYGQSTSVATNLTAQPQPVNDGYANPYAVQTEQFDYQMGNQFDQAPPPIQQNRPTPAPPKPRRQLSRRERHNLEMNALLNILEEEKKKLGITDENNGSFRSGIDRSSKPAKQARRKQKRRVISKEEVEKIQPRKPRPERRSGVVYLSEDQKMGREEVNVPAPEKLPTSEEQHSFDSQNNVELDLPTIEPVVDEIIEQPHDVVHESELVDDTQSPREQDPPQTTNQDFQADLALEPPLSDDVVDETAVPKDYKEPVYNPVPLRERNTETDQSVYDILNQVDSGQSTDSKIEIVTPKRPRPRIAPRRPSPTPETVKSESTVKKTNDVAPPVLTQPTVQKSPPPTQPVSTPPISPPDVDLRSTEARHVEQTGLDERAVFQPETELSRDINPPIVDEPDIVDFNTIEPLSTQVVSEPRLPVVPQVVEPEPIDQPVLPVVPLVSKPEPIDSSMRPIETVQNNPPQTANVDSRQQQKQNSPTVNNISPIPPPVVSHEPQVAPKPVVVSDTPTVTPTFSPPPVVSSSAPPVTPAPLPPVIPTLPLVSTISSPETTVQRKANDQSTSLETSEPTLSEPIRPEVVKPILAVPDTAVQRTVLPDVIDAPILNEPTESSSEPVVPIVVDNSFDTAVQRDVQDPTVFPVVNEPLDRVEPAPSVFDTASFDNIQRTVVNDVEPSPVDRPVRPNLTAPEIGRVETTSQETRPSLSENTPPVVAKASLAAPPPVVTQDQPLPTTIEKTPVQRQINEPETTTVPPVIRRPEEFSSTTQLVPPLQPQLEPNKTDTTVEPLVTQMQPEPMVQRAPEEQVGSQPQISDEMAYPRQLKNDLFDSSIQNVPIQTPLEDVLPVQRHTDYIKPDPIQGDKDYQEPTYNPVPLRDRNTETDENVKALLQRIESEKSTGSSIETVTPKRPRPKIAPQVSPPSPVQTVSPNSGQSQPPSPLRGVESRLSTRPPEPPEMIETEIGSLPSDLWTVLGETPPTHTPQPAPTLPTTVENETEQPQSPMIRPTLSPPIVNSMPSVVAPETPISNLEPSVPRLPNEVDSILTDDLSSGFDDLNARGLEQPIIETQNLDNFSPVTPPPLDLPNTSPIIDSNVEGRPRLEGRIAPPVPPTSPPNLIPTEIGSLPSDLWSAIGETPPILPPEPIQTLKPDVAPTPRSLPVNLPPITAVASPTTNWQSSNQPLVVSTPEPVFSPTVSSTPSETLVIQRTPADAVPSTRTPLDFVPSPQHVSRPTALPNTPSNDSNDVTVQRKIDDKPMTVSHVLPPRTIQREVSMDTKNEAIEEAQSQDQNMMMPPPIDVDELARQVYSELKRRMGRDWERGRRRYL